MSLLFNALFRFVITFLPRRKDPDAGKMAKNRKAWCAADHGVT